MVLFVSADWIALGFFNVNFWTEKTSDVADAVVDHGWSLKAQSPCDDSVAIRSTHWLEHFGSEDATVSDFDHLVQLRVEAEDLHTRLGIWVVCWLELDLGDT